MNTKQGSRQARKDQELLQQLLCNATYKLPDFGYVRFENPVVFTSFDDGILKKLSIVKRFIVRVLVKLLKSLADIDKLYHIDVITEGCYNNNHHATFGFDAKNIEIQNICTCNYSLSDHCRNYFLKKDDYKLRWLTFRLNVIRNKSSVRLNSFIAVRAKDVFNNCNAIDGKFLYSFKEILSKCNNKFFIGNDISELREFEKFHRFSTGL